MKKILLGIIEVYQKKVSPNWPAFFVGGSLGCRFYPSCSEYSKGSISKLGVTKGLLKSFVRIIRCNPLSKGGVDLP